MTKCGFVALVGGLWIAVLSSVVRADVTYSGGAGELEVVRMTVTPAAEPVPALKYRLLPRDIDLVAGNASPYYYRVLMEMRRRMDSMRKKYDDEEVDKWYSTNAGAFSMEQLPLEKVRDAVTMTIGDSVGDQLNEATKRRDCDWQLGVEEMRGVKIVEFLLPEFQESRQIARMLALKARLAIAERRYGDAVDVMRMNYRLGRDIARPPFLVCGLIGIAVDGITNATVIDLIAAPNSPNLYWSLTELPEPLVDMREAARFELDFGPRLFPFIHNAETTDHSPQEWNQLFTQGFRDLQSLGGGGPNPQNNMEAGLVATGAALLGYPHAKTQLIAQGMDRERVEKMSIGQVMAIYTERVYQRFADDWEKLWYMPFSDTRNFNEVAEKRLRAADLRFGGEEREVMPIVAVLMPAVDATRSAQVKLDREVAALRVIEALRMYAAGHDGRLPARLDDIDQVPVPLNPATGKPFMYRLEGATAILELPASDGVRNSSRRFEIQMAAMK